MRLGRRPSRLLTPLRLFNRNSPSHRAAQDPYYGCFELPRLQDIARPQLSLLFLCRKGWQAYALAATRLCEYLDKLAAPSEVLRIAWIRDSSS